MEIFIYFLIFIMGTLFGSFFSLAIYRIPLGENITTKRSFCPNCKHRLGGIDLIPIFSYIFLKRKCRYCSNKISSRYLVLEIFTGILFLTFWITLDVNFLQIEISKIFLYVFSILYFVTIILIAGIDKERNKIAKQVILFGMIVLLGYILYLYILKNVNMYKYVIYLLIMTAILILDTFFLKNMHKESYTLDVLFIFFYITMFSSSEIMIFTTFFTILISSIKVMSNIFTKNQKETEKEKINTHIPIACYMCISNILLIVGESFFINN